MDKVKIVHYFIIIIFSTITTYLIVMVSRFDSILIHQKVQIMLVLQWFLQQFQKVKLLVQKLISVVMILIMIIYVILVIQMYLAMMVLKLFMFGIFPMHGKLSYLQMGILLLRHSHYLTILYPTRYLQKKVGNQYQYPVIIFQVQCFH